MRLGWVLKQHRSHQIVSFTKSQLGRASLTDDCRESSSFLITRRADFKMDYGYPDMSAFFTPGSSATPNQAPELHRNNSDFNGHALGSLGQLEYSAPTDHYISNPVDVLPVPSTYPPSNAPTSSDQSDVLAPYMGPPTKKRNRKAPTVHADVWEPYKARITELLDKQKPRLLLKEVKDTIEREFGFVAGYVSPG